MRKLLLLFIAVPIIVFGQVEKIINQDNITNIGELIVMKSDSTLVTGKVKMWHFNSALKLQAIYKDGKSVGVWKRWNEEGKLISEETYKDGKRISFKEY